MNQEIEAKGDGWREPSGGQKVRGPLRGPWGGWEAGSRCLRPQTYKSKRGASAGRGAAGLVGEAGPFLLGKSRRVSVSGWGRVGTGEPRPVASQAELKSTGPVSRHRSAFG